MDEDEESGAFDFSTAAGRSEGSLWEAQLPLLWLLLATAVVAQVLQHTLRRRPRRRQHGVPNNFCTPSPTDTARTAHGQSPPLPPPQIWLSELDSSRREDGLYHMRHGGYVATAAQGNKAADRAPLSQRAAAAPHHAGWSSKLLESCQAHAQSISSMAGLLSSPEFKAHARKRKSPWYVAQVEARLQVFKDLWRVDPVGFHRLLDRRDMQDYDCVRPSRLLLVGDCGVCWLAGSACLHIVMPYLCNTLIMASSSSERSSSVNNITCSNASSGAFNSTAHAASSSYDGSNTNGVTPAPTGLQCLLMAGWLCWLLSAWAGGCSSPLTRRRQVYTVHCGNSSGGGTEISTEPVASTFKLAFCCLLEGLFATATFNASVALSLLLVVITPRRQTLAQLLLRLQAVKEVHQPFTLQKSKLQGGEKGRPPGATAAAAAGGAPTSTWSAGKRFGLPPADMASDGFNACLYGGQPVHREMMCGGYVPPSYAATERPWQDRMVLSRGYGEVGCGGAGGLDQPGRRLGPGQGKASSLLFGLTSDSGFGARYQT